jgi:F-type H+-transporting ATPase subunit delta
MASSRVAIRYVKSLLSLAEDQQKLEAVHRDLQLFSRIAMENRDLVLVLRNPIIKSDKKQMILKAIFGGKVNDLTMAFLDIICRKGRENILPQVAEAFHHLYNAHEGIGSATVISAAPLDKELRKEIETIAKALNRKNVIELHERVDNELIGGFILKVEDRQIDASVRSKLNKLKIQFTRD